ncbi:MAG: hypothetical protein Q8J64_02015 [Thermodesulfovibrionales bacterium]|nr:hypothetical protein [Thermodesulfovibrionales bacterium]
MLGKEKTSEYMLYACLLLFVVLLPITKIADFDLFFHLRLGSHVWETLSLYGPDEFSYTAGASLQYRGEWLSNALLYAVYKYSGFTGLGVMKSVLFSALALVIWSTLKAAAPKAGALPKVLTIIVFAYAVRFRLDLRPYYFTYISLALFIYAFMRYRMPGAGTGRLYLLVPLQALWANMHGGFIIGPPLLGLFLIAEAARRRSLDIKSFIPFFAVFLAGGLSPEGFRPYLNFLSFTAPAASSGASQLGEWQSLTTHLLWGFGLRYTWGFQVIFAGAMLYLAAEAAKRRFDFFMLVLLAGSAFYTVRHVRLMDISSILLAPVFFLGLQRLSGLVRLGEVKSGYRDTLNFLTGSLVVCLLVFSVMGSSIYSFGLGEKEGIFPQKAAGFLDRHKIGGNGFNTVTAGSYMLWQSPHRKVFIDGRLVQPEPLQVAYKKAIDTAEGFNELDGKYDFNYALIDYNPKSMWRFPMHLNSNPDWALVYWDDTAALYLKNNAANSALIQKKGYRALMPSFNDFGYMDTAIKHLKETVLGEVDRDVSLNPANQEAHLAKAYVSYYLGLKDIAQRELQTALGMKPDTAFEHIAMAQLLIEKGETEAAKKELKRAVRLNPYDTRAKDLLKGISGGR